MNSIEISNLQKNYKNFSLTIDELNIKTGFITGFIGPNGSGKTTTIKSLFGMIKPDFGKIKIFNTDITKDTKTKEDIYKVVIAATELAKTKTGGLIVLERDIQINDIIDTGVKVDAEVSPQLVVNLFTPNTPLHDGAVIISKNKIMAAACILPLANDKDIAKEVGTRHRAGLGISKESDAIAIIVSEETGKISIAKDGTLIADLKEDTLKTILIKNMITKRFGNEKRKSKEEKVKKK